MRTLLTILLTLPLLCFGQYPITDNFTSIGGAGEWTNQSAHANMGVEDGTHLCYALGTNYIDNQTYIFESPDYGTQFVDDGNVTMRFSANITLDTRVNGDIMYVGWLDGGVWSYAFIGSYIAPATTYFVDVPATTTQFRFEFDSNGSGGASGHANKFVHIDWSEISVVTILPIELIAFKGSEDNGDVLLEWITASEINNNYFEVYWSEDGENWSLIGHKDGAGNSNMNITYYHKDSNTKTNNYYKLKQVDFDGKSTESKIIYIEIDSDSKLKNTRYINVLGQEVTSTYMGKKIELPK